MNHNSILFIQGHSILTVHTQGKAYQAKNTIKGPKTWKVQLYREVMCQSRSSHKVLLRRDCHQGNPARLADSRLSEPLLAWASISLAKKELPLPSYTYNNIPQTPTRPRLGEPLSPERDGVSLKRKLSAWARARAQVWACFCKSRLGEAWSLGRERRVSPLFALHSYPNTLQTAAYIHLIFHNGTTLVQSIKTVAKCARNIL